METRTEYRLHHEVHGHQGPYLLLVHGMLSSRAQWRLNLEAFQRFCRPVVVELFGHGRSPTPAEATHYHPLAYLSQFEKLRQELGVERWLLCGQSLGASLTIRYALEFPRRVIAQVVTNSRSALSDEQWIEPMQEQARKLQEQGSQYIAQHPLNPARSKRMAPVVRQAFEEDVRLISVEGLARTGLYTVCNAPLRGQLKLNRVPCLLVNGVWEKKFQAHRDYFLNHTPHSEVVDLPGGHAVNLDAPEEFNQAVSAFYSRYLEPVSLAVM